MTNDSRQVIAFSLYGSADKYRRGLLENIALVPSLFPGWAVLVYCDRANFLRLQPLDRPGYVRLLCPKEASAGSEGMSWRYLASTRQGVTTAIFRDTDSVLTRREAEAVKLWLDSPFNAHLIRDHPYHTSPIMGGMFGVRGEALQFMGKVIRAQMEKSRFTQYGDDQVFLTKTLYPRLRKTALVHTDCVKYLGEYTMPLPPLGGDQSFIGAYAYPTAEEAALHAKVRSEVGPRTFLFRSRRGARLLRALHLSPRPRIKHRAPWLL